jgi:YVTN family beta-propeller protein
MVPLGGSAVPRQVVITPDGSRAYVASQNPGSLFVLDTTTNQLITNIPLGADSEPGYIAVTPDGIRLYVASVASDTVLVFDTASNGLIVKVPVGAQPVHIGFSSAPHGCSAGGAET